MPDPGDDFGEFMDQMARVKVAPRDYQRHEPKATPKPAPASTEVKMVILCPGGEPGTWAVLSGPLSTVAPIIEAMGVRPDSLSWEQVRWLTSCCHANGLDVLLANIPPLA